MACTRSTRSSAFDLRRVPNLLPQATPIVAKSSRRKIKLLFCRAASVLTTTAVCALLFAKSASTPIKTSTNPSRWNLLPEFSKLVIMSEENLATQDSDCSGNSKHQ